MGFLMLHVGYPKCASTMMQSDLFPELRDARFVSGADLHDAFGTRDMPGGEAERERVLESLARSIAEGSMPVIFSSEHLSMPPDWLETMDVPCKRYLDRPEITALVRRFFRDVRILMVVRRQEDWIVSWYQERVKRYETRSIGVVAASRSFRGILDSLHYSRVLDEYRAAFGAEAVTVIPVEELRSDPKAFQAKVLGVLGLPPRDLPNRIVKSRVSSAAVNSRRHVNKALKAVSRRTGGSTRIDRGLFAAVKRVYAFDWILVRLFGAYLAEVRLPAEARASLAEDNARLAAMTGIDLGRWGYALPAKRAAA